jgi:hypothetical protein
MSFSQIIVHSNGMMNAPSCMTESPAHSRVSVNHIIDASTHIIEGVNHIMQASTHIIVAKSERV